MAKHWKSFVKKEETPKKEDKELEDIGSLLSKEGKPSDKSLEDVAEFNSSLKSLIEEQKQLEDQMAELTGKKTASNTDKRYENDIKTIDQKKKEEKAAAAKRQKRKENHRKKQDERWDVTPSFTLKKKNSSTIPAIAEQRKKAKPNTELLHKKKARNPVATLPKLPKTPKKVQQPKRVAKKKKQPTTIIEYGEKIQKAAKSIDDFIQKPKKSTQKEKKQNPKRQEKTGLQTIAKRKVSSVIGAQQKRKKEVSKVAIKSKEKLHDFVTNTTKSKPIATVQPIVKKASEHLETFQKVTKKVKKVNHTFQTIQKTGNDVQTGIEKLNSVVASPELKSLGKKLTKGTEIVNKVGNKIKKVDKVFNTANKHLEKTQAVTSLFQKKLKAVDFISAKDTKTNNAFDFDFIQKQETKKEETTSFTVANKKLNVAINAIKTIKNIKKGIGILNEAKKKKDSFSF
ncbi:hypothetical protein [Kordia jejudonensis]|uniref:hypothetical protein n=1 Tax=Kordia jejudonensis TaxID=1348245 RepID=UPI00062973A2|nr:hypothetical protein [Kordia jejudonensis]